MTCPTNHHSPLTNHQDSEYGAPILAEVGGGGDYIATYTHGVQGLVSQRRGSTTNWYHYDDLGSTRNLTNSSQTITDAYTYKAFGEIPSGTGSTTNPFRYIGSLNYYKDADSSLLLLGARYYGPQWGTFITPDPAGGIVSGVPAWAPAPKPSQRPPHRVSPVSTYTYSWARPLTWADPGGLGVWDKIKKLARAFFQWMLPEPASTGTGLAEADLGRVLMCTALRAKIADVEMEINMAASSSDYELVAKLEAQRQELLRRYYRGCVESGPAAERPVD